MSTGACSLCEQALDLLISMPELRGTTLTVRDVALDDALTARYGARLPVLCAGARELDLPFNRAEVAQLLRAV
ncbi:MAG: glutaredoxin family protein [Gammaproteobacteria bacterium]